MLQILLNVVFHNLPGKAFDILDSNQFLHPTKCVYCMYSAASKCTKSTADHTGHIHWTPLDPFRLQDNNWTCRH